jgi:septal ring factor EnvC (AmiA/AmiB activator)
MKDECIIDGVPCPNEPQFYYMWEWGDDGVCCTDHRGVLLTRSGQLSRTITFSSLARGGKREYTPPQLQPLSPDVGLLKTKLAEEMEQRKALEQQLAKLEREREASSEKTRALELRIEDLVRQNAELKAAAANAQLQADAALELATSPDNADAKGEAAPDTLSGGSSRGKRSR